MTVRVTLVYNPTAGDEQHAGEDLVEQLAEAGYDARLLSNRKKIPRRLEDPGELVVVAGGDGSVKSVALALAGRGVPMAILPRFGDQPLNAAAVEAARAGLVVPGPERIGDTVAALLTNPAYAGVAAAIAVEVRASDWTSKARTSTVPNRGCGRTSHQM